MTTTTHFTYDDEGALICAHRDLSCCPLCAATDPAIIDVFGKHFWIDDPAERQQLLAML